MTSVVYLAAMSETLVGQSTSTTCSSCARTVRMVPVDGRMVAVEPEVIAVVPTTRHGGTLSSAKSIPARVVHADRCAAYQREAERAERRKEIKAFEKRTGKRRGGGL